MTTQIVQDLVIEKLQAEQKVQQLLNALGAVAITEGTTKDKKVHELRISRAALNRLNGQDISLRILKSGVVVVTVEKADE